MRRRKLWTGILLLTLTAASEGVGRDLPIEDASASQYEDAQPQRISHMPPPRAFLQEELQDLPIDSAPADDAEQAMPPPSSYEEDEPMPHRYRRHRTNWRVSEAAPPLEEDSAGGVGLMEQKQMLNPLQEAERVAARKHTVMKQFMKRFSRNMRLAVLEDSAGDMPENERRAMIHKLKGEAMRADTPSSNSPDGADFRERAIAPRAAFLGRTRRVRDVDEASDDSEWKPVARVRHERRSTAHHRHKVQMLNKRHPALRKANATVDSTLPQPVGQSGETDGQQADVPDEPRQSLVDSRDEALQRRKALSLAKLRQVQRQRRLLREMQMERAREAQEAEEPAVDAPSDENEEAPLSADSEPDIPLLRDSRKERLAAWQTLECDDASGIGCNPRTRRHRKRREREEDDDDTGPRSASPQRFTLPWTSILCLGMLWTLGFMM